MTILVNHKLADDVRALADRLGEVRFRSVTRRAFPGLVHFRIHPMASTLTAAEIYLDTDDGQLLGTVLPKEGKEAWGEADALTLLATLLPEEAAPVKPKTTPAKSTPAKAKDPAKPAQAKTRRTTGRTS
ncbi:hypothetical protein AB0K18_43220 [Nonomuraea sp. NPDC049421]|uniref:hypothetical protein n=1 Tax=Nonomuraea sp. NPDC049421 TaxID=3155275 RepID=UPI003442AD24